VEQKDVRKANDLIGELRQHSSAYGNGVQRMAYYFVEALVNFQFLFCSTKLFCIGLCSP
jgi:hypothetical protein